MAGIFKDSELQKQLDLNGYVVIPLLSQEEVDSLLATYQENVGNNDGFYSTSFSTDEELKQKLNNAIENALDGKVGTIANPYRKLGSCFLSKAPGAAGEMPIHQDWTVVDEPNFDSYTFWVPLCDVNEKNGAMRVVKGSHRFGGALRAPSLVDPFKDVLDEVRKDLEYVPMKAGEAIVFSQALLHASPPNLSDTPRVVATYGLIHNDAQLLFYHKREDGITEKYEVPDHFFQAYNTQIGQAPTVGQKIEEFEYPEKLVTADEYRAMKLNFAKRKQAMYKMIPIFKDAEKQAFFEKEGYAVFPLLNEDEVNELKTYYESLNLKDEKGFGFHVSMDQSDKEMCKQVREKVWGVGLPRLREHLNNIKPFVASMVMKEPNPKGVVPAHQDWSFVDKEEEGYSSITCWITLVPTTMDNGALGVIRGSHKIMQNHRPSPSPQTPVPLSEHMFSIFPYLNIIEMQPGEVLMFDNRTFHASLPNTTDAVRLAVGIGVTQADAQLVHYYLKPDGNKNTLQRHNVDEDFFLKYDNSKLSQMYDAGETIKDYPLAAEVPYLFDQYTSEELAELIKAAGNEFNVPMCEKLSVLFGYNMDGSKKDEPKQETADEILDKVVAEIEEEEKKSFFEVYTPYNVYREIKYRLTGR